MQIVVDNPAATRLFRSEPTVLPRSFATTPDFRQPNEGAGVQTSQA